jgi:hypothetical protein
MSSAACHLSAVLVQVWDRRPTSMPDMRATTSVERPSAFRPSMSASTLIVVAGGTSRGAVARTMLTPGGGRVIVETVPAKARRPLPPAADTSGYRSPMTTAAAASEVAVAATS